MGATPFLLSTYYVNSIGLSQAVVLDGGGEGGG